ncbi:putative formaldehyde dehydrogenase AdhA [Paramyrothecium foliicola]|nr:putative formaldehyde dehydrogenase AdhA [Paramyrothecium foliicola]
MAPYKFESWVAEDPSAADGKMVWREYTPKTWEERDVDIKISHSAICAVDLYAMRSAWVVGEVVRVDSEAKDKFMLGDIVGFGSAIDTCGSCSACDVGREHHCPGTILTYGAVHKNGEPIYGGHGTYARVPSTLVPLREAGVGPGKKVGVVGLGGLGHIAVLFAKAMGAEEVVVLSRKSDKKDDARHLGASDFIATDEEADWITNNAGRLDVIISTAASSKLSSFLTFSMPMTGYVHLLKIDGALIQLGAPDSPIALDLFPFVMGQKRIVGSIIGSSKQIREMLDLAAEKQIKPWVQQRPTEEASQAMVDMAANRARYHYVLTN